MTVEQRVLELLIQAREHHFILDGAAVISCPGGWIPWYVFSSISICGSTQGDRRRRELKANPEINAKYIFEKKHDGQKYYYRITPRQATAQSNLAFAESTL